LSVCLDGRKDGWIDERDVNLSLYSFPPELQLPVDVCSGASSQNSD
jgi:hypothetical protein